MSRSLLFPLTIMLLIATAVAMVASAILLPTPGVAEFSAPGDDDAVMQFYATVNEIIATGNPGALRRVVAPSFIDETPLPGVNPGRTGLEEYLAALHASDPGMRLEAEIVVSSAEQIMTRVQVHPGAARSPQTAALDLQRAIWSPIEVFRVADGVVTGRWGHTAGLTLAQPLAKQTLELPSPTPRVVSLMRVTQTPGTQWDAPRVAGPQLLFLEAGVLEVQAVPGSAGEAAHPPLPGSVASDNGRAGRAQRTQRVLLTAGMTWQAPAGASITTTSTGSSGADLLVVTFSEPVIPHGPAPEPVSGNLPFGVTAQVLAGDLATSLGTSSVTVNLEQIAFAPDAAMNLWSTEGPLLLAVKSGQIETTAGGTSWVRRRRDGMSATSRTSIPTAQNGMLVLPGGMVALRNVEQTPACLLVVSIQRADADRGS